MRIERIDFLILCIALFVAGSCSSEKASEMVVQSTPESGYSGTPSKPVSGPDFLLEIVPPTANRTTTLKLTAKGFKLAQAEIQWFVNGIAASPSPPLMFSLGETKKGDQIWAIAKTGGTQIASNTVTVENTPPKIKRASLAPEIFKPGDTLGIDASAEDIDEDDITMQYEWSVNGEPAGTTSRLTIPLKRGDKFTVTIVPFDGESYGPPAIIKREIVNIPPQIIEHHETKLNGKIFSYQVKASDPDGDTLTYALPSAPPGMTIDASAGLITWEVPLDFKGPANASVVVDDGHGGTARYDFSATIQ